MLEVKDLTVSYGNKTVVRDASFEVDTDEIVALVGANGSGKTTILKAISGLLKPSSGEIRFSGRLVNGLLSQEIVRLGISHAPERRRLFAQMTVLENLELGAYLKNTSELKDQLEKVFSYFPVLKERSKQRAGTLSGGEQQMLCIARALMSRPSLLLMDEPTIGLAPFMVRGLSKTIRTINSEGSSILLVEQNVKMALGVSNRAYVLQTGEIVRKASSHELLADETIIKSYLGE